MPGKKKPSVSATTVGAVASVARLAYDLARPATCPACNGRTYVFVCINCPRIVPKPRRER
jgi:hypothetical protein